MSITTVKKALARNQPAYTPQQMGKLPPQDLDAEMALLSCVLLSPEAMYAAAQVIKQPDAFYKPQHQHLWQAMQQLHVLDAPIDVVTLQAQLNKNGTLAFAGGLNYLMQLSQLVNTPTNAEAYAHLVHEKYLARRLITISAESTNLAYNETTDVFELLNSTTTQLDNIITDVNANFALTFAETVAEVLHTLRNMQPDSLSGVPTFSPSLDAHLLGLQPQNLVVIAGRPGMGKTSVAWHLALNQAKNNIPVGFFSLEMTDRELVQKLLSSEVGINTQALRSGKLTQQQWQHLTDALRTITTYPIHLTDTAGLTLPQLMATARNWVRKHGVKVIYIDYLGKIRTTDKKFGTREQEVSYITGHLKDLAKSLNIPIVALSQLSREVERRNGDKRPQLSDLRDSGSIEQDADIVLFPYRPEYYEIFKDEHGTPYPKGFTELIIAKYRHGQPGTLRWLYEPEFSRFRDCG